MKKLLRFCLLLYMTMNMASVHTFSFSVAIPQDLVKKNATLLLLVCDNKGQKSLRKYRLGSAITNTVTQEELEIAAENEQADDEAMEIFTDASNLSDAVAQESFVVCFQLDSQFQVLRVMVLKDCLLDHNPFDIVTIPLSAEMEFEQFYEDIQGVDELEALTNSFEDSDLSNLSKQQQMSWLQEYMLYAKIIAYEVKKAINVSAWWN
jgi:hypothetical protein